MYKWYLPTLSEILTLSAPAKGERLAQKPRSAQAHGIQTPAFKSPVQQRLKAEREWTGAVAALNQLIQQSIESLPPTLSERPEQPVQALLLSGPFPILQQADWMEQIATWVFTAGAPGEILQVLPPAESAAKPWKTVPTLPLRADDPLAAEQFCLVLTPEFSLVMTLGETETGDPAFLFSFDPEIVWQVWRSLQARLQLTASHLIKTMNRLVQQFTPVVPDYRTVSEFSRLMLANLPEAAEPSERPAAASESVTLTASPPSGSPVTQTHEQVNHPASDLLEDPSCRTADTELLQALAHEVRTPLSTIRTLTRLLLKRKDLSPDVIKRLELIDRECTEQIDRFSLIFRAVELQTCESKSALMPLAPISLTQMIQQNIGRWQQQASQHRHTLDILLPQKLPLVSTDPMMLDQALTGLIDRITHRLPPGSHIQVQVTPAGNQLKLQMLSQPQDWQNAKNSRQATAGTTGSKELRAKIGFAPVVRSIGQMLMFQPETGNLSLNMAVTKSLFQALGGKLIVREHPYEGEVLTIFLPLAAKKAED